MNTRRFGRTELQVSEIVFGGGYVGGLLVLKDDETRRRAIRLALDAGINLIDTAPLYGQGRSEEALGWLLGEIEDEPYVSTKVRLDLEGLDDIAGQIERSVHDSLQRLRRDSVDLLQLHNPIAAEGGAGRIAVADVLRDGGAADGLDRMREQGLTRFVGLTALGEAPAICEAIDSGRFDSAQVYYNLLNPSAARSMPPKWTGQDFSGVADACKRHDVAMMGIRIFASGVLATDVRCGREVVVAEDSDLEVETARARAALAALGEEHGTRAQTALRFGLANPDLACVVAGMAEIDHLQQVLAAAAAGALPAAAIDRIEPVYESGFERAG